MNYNILDCQDRATSSQFGQQFQLQLRLELHLQLQS